MQDGYLNLIKGGKGEYTEKKSRFIGQAEPVLTEEDAYAFIEKIKKKHYDARHNCFAFSVGGKLPLLRFSDDGEPQGTAGKPILEMIGNSGIHNICIVVTRYFGGTLLGTGGLVRAYTEAAGRAIADCETKWVQRLYPVLIRTNYTDLGKVQFLLNREKLSVSDTVFAEEVSFQTEIPVAEYERIQKEIINATNARAVLVKKEERFG